MREDILLKYIEKAGIQTGTLSALYDLSGFVDESEGVNKDSLYKLTSGYDNSLDTYLIYNKLRDTGTQLFDTGDGAPIFNADNYPAVITSASASITGSGYFDGQASMKVLNRITGDSWTCFLDFSGGFGDPSLSQVLISSMTGASSTSGLNIGVNGSNRLYYEYITGVEDGREHRYTETLPDHLKKLNLISVSRNPSMLEVSLHKPNEATSSIKTSPEDFVESEDLYFGGFMHGAAYSGFYTGFSGYINTITLFDDYISEEARNTIAESYFLDSHSYASLVTGERFTKEVTGVEVQSLQEGYTTTGYELKISHTYKNEAGQDVPVYFSSGVLGRNYRNILVDLTGDNTIRSITGYYQDETSARKDDYVSSLNSVPGYIKFVEELAQGELLEIYNHATFVNNINYSPSAEYFFGNITNTEGNDFTVKGFQLKNDNFSYNPSDKQPFVQLFRNGVLHHEISGLYSVIDIFNNKDGALKEVGDPVGAYHGDYFINNGNGGTDGVSDILSERIENNKYEIALNSQEEAISDSNSLVLYDIVSGASLTGDYQGSNKHFTGEYLNRDIYLNGVKLMSGHEYSESSTAGEVSYLLNASEIGTDRKGELLFIPQASPDFVRVTGEAGGELFEVGNVFYEQVWRNGIRQIPGVDYFRAPKNSLIGTGGASFFNDSFAFDYSTSTIDVKIQEKVPETKNKLFSLTSQGKRNLFDSTS